MSLWPKRHSDQPRDCVVIGLVVAIITVAIVPLFIIWQLGRLNNTPDWWAALDNNPVNTEQSGIELENRITTALTRVRLSEDADWNAAINQDQLNSWLTHRLKGTIHSFTGDTWIDELGEIRIALSQAGMTIGAQLRHAHGLTIVWAIIQLGTNDQGRFVVTTDRVYIGSMRVPKALASKYISNENLGDAQVDLGDGRVVFIRALRTGDRRLEFALRTELAN
ncbi:MAG: hypothetical protein JKY43_01670 [Phycisphaerales bacterium]|nr:hypothetical protein [Phycisphaerales bacterium]